MPAAQLPIGLDEHVERNDENCFQKFWQMSVLNLEEGKVSGASCCRNLGQ